MELPPDLFDYPDLNLVVWKPQGVLNEKTVNKIITFLGEKESSTTQLFNRYSDTTLLKAIDLNFRYVFHVALYRRLSYAGRPAAKSAFLVDNRGSAHYFKVHALLTDHSALEVKTFEKREEAAKWLGVPDEILERV